MTFRATQDPDAYLDWSIDWSQWLSNAETLADVTWTASDAQLITLDSDTFSSDTATVWVSDLTLGQVASATCHITTTLGREDDRTIRFTPKAM